MNEKIPLYTTSDYATDCDCPIHAEGRPFVAPLGIHSEDEVCVEEIDAETAEKVYLANHSYMGEVHQMNIVHHGIYYRARQVGAMIYRMPCIGRLKLGIMPDCGLTIANPDRQVVLVDDVVDS